MKKRYISLLSTVFIFTAVSCTSPYVRPEQPRFVLTNPPVEMKEKPVLIKPPYLEGMEPEGTFDGPTMDEYIEKLMAEGKMKAPVPDVPEMESAEPELSVEERTEECSEDTTLPEVSD